MKKVKRRCSSHDPMTAFKHHRLLMKIQGISQESASKKKRLEILKRTKSVLLAEVKFLKRRFDDLTTGKKANAIFSSANKKALIGEEDSKQRTHNTSDLKDEKLPAIRRGGAIFDLNETWSEEKEDDEREKNEHEAKAKQQVSEKKTSACRNRPSTMGKRRISWQDPVALRV